MIIVHVGVTFHFDFRYRHCKKNNVNQWHMQEPIGISVGNWICVCLDNSRIMCASVLVQFRRHTTTYHDVLCKRSCWLNLEGLVMKIRWGFSYAHEQAGMQSRLHVLFLCCSMQLWGHAWIVYVLLPLLHVTICRSKLVSTPTVKTSTMNLNPLTQKVFW